MTVRPGVQGVGWWSFRVRHLEVARAFYTRLGFRLIGEGPTYFHCAAGDGTWLNIGTLSRGAAEHRPVADRN